MFHSVINKPLTLSIIIPAYNEERYLQTCLDSIAAQTVRPDEVIVIDNNSSDATPQVAAACAFVTVVHEDRQGIVFARNAGFEVASSTLIARIDADTILPPDWVAQIKQHYVQRGHGADLFAATGPSMFRNSTGRIVWYALHRLLFFWPSRLVTGHHTLSGSNMYMTRSLWLRVREHVCLRTDIHEDMDLAIHVAKAGAPIVFSRAFPNYMLGRGLLHKLRYYIPMWWRILFIRHSF